MAPFSCPAGIGEREAAQSDKITRVRWVPLEPAAAPPVRAGLPCIHLTGEGFSMHPTFLIQDRSPIRRSILGSLAIGLALAAAVSPAKAGIVDPAFAAHLATLPADEQVSVIIMMADQVPIATLDAELRATRATLPVRHERVMVDLQTKAEETQPPLLAALEARRATGEVRGFTPYWIANLVVAQMQVRTVAEIARRAEVGVIYSNFTASLIEPIGGVPVAPPLGEGEVSEMANSTTPGIRAINVPRVWYELGITGAGRLVCGFDTGVLGSHVALASRWRGTHVPFQQAWKDVLGNTQFPQDPNGHGTHTMGTMVGRGAPTADTVGVAFNAEWIACNAIGQGVGSEFDNDVIAGFQWTADPDGNPNTTDDVPDVVQNSWRINENFGGNYIDCDPRWWAVMDGCEAAGCAVVFSAGNEGPGAQSIGSPPDRITTLTNAYAIGAIDAQQGINFPYPIASFSSRGPSGCAGTPNQKIKPEVVAPGVNVFSTVNTGGYASSGWSGTSMSGPHVSGIFALMREADPNLDVTTMKEVIMQTARDLGTAGEDNTFGWGVPDAYAAVSFVMTGLAEVNGTVTHATLGTPIGGATVTVVGANRFFTTNTAGQYSGFVAAGTYNLTASHAVFQTGQVNGVMFVVGTPTTVNFGLNGTPEAVPPQVSDVTCLFATNDLIGPYPIQATATDNSGYVVGRLHYRVNNGSFSFVNMAPLGNNRFQGGIPAQALGSQIDYYVQALDAALNSDTDPPNAPADVYSFAVATATAVVDDDAELDRGWTLGVVGDNATDGFWARANPAGTVQGNIIIQPEDDHTPVPGVNCFITGPAGGSPSDDDVDTGCTTLLSPIFDVANATEAVVRYWRWYTNEAVFAADDIFSIDISSNGGSTWQPFERVGPGTAQPWIKVEKGLRCSGVNLTSQMRLRFIACDGGQLSLTEAGVDDVFIGRFDLTSAINEPDAAPTGAFRLVAVRPNPFNPSTLVTYEVAGREKVELRVFDVQGRLVKTLVDGIIEPGVHSAHFDGRNEGGQDLASGTYFLELTAGTKRLTEKLSLVR